MLTWTPCAPLCDLGRRSVHVFRSARSAGITQVLPALPLLPRRCGLSLNRDLNHTASVSICHTGRDTALIPQHGARCISTAYIFTPHLWGQSSSLLAPLVLRASLCTFNFQCSAVRTKSGDVPERPRTFTVWQVAVVPQSSALELASILPASWATGRVVSRWPAQSLLQDPQVVLQPRGLGGLVVARGPG